MNDVHRMHARNNAQPAILRALSVAVENFENPRRQDDVRPQPANPINLSRLRAWEHQSARAALPVCPAALHGAYLEGKSDGPSRG